MPPVIDPASGSFSAAVWFNINDYSITRHLLQQEDNSGTGRTWLGVQTDGSLFTFLGGSNMNSAAATVTTGEWHHAAVSYDGTSLNLYLDGALVNSQAKPIESSDGRFFLGVNKDLNGNYFSGRMDEVLMYNRALAPEEVLALANRDVDGDGINNDVDNDPLVPSNDFSDGSTTGSILDAGEQTLRISDPVDPAQGVLVEVVASAGPTPAQVESCNGAAQHFLDDMNDSVVITCGSVILDVTGGQIDNTLFAMDGTIAAVNVGAGNGLTFKPDRSLVSAPSTNSAQLVVNVNGVQKTLDPGGEAIAVALNKFVVLGEEGVELKQNSQVLSGYVGANQASDGPYLAGSEEVTLGNNVKFQSPDSWLLGDSLNLKNNVNVYDVFTNNPINGKGHVLGEVHTNVSLPLGPAFPEVPAFTPGSQDLAVNNNDSLTLDAGSYGSLDVGNNATVILTGGIYAFSEWSIGNNVHILIQAPVDIWIAGRLDSGPNGSLSSGPGFSPDSQGHPSHCHRPKRR